MHISIIGSGNVATVFGRRLAEAGHTIGQVYSRNLAHAEVLGRELLAGAIDSLDQLLPGADVYLLAASDQGVADAAARLRLGDALVLHTAGALSIDVLAGVSSRYGVLYPLQTIRKEVTGPLRIPLLVDGNSAQVRSAVANLGEGISDLVRTAGDEERLSLHIAAVVVNNFPNYLYGLTQAFANGAGVDFHLLQPLIAETARRLENHDPFDVQTGPAVRGDQSTILMHLGELQAYPELQRWYALFSEALLLRFAGQTGDFTSGAE
jgi:predicted short-subunit dehydrogenase-like oxidoreductase (DUF2520 family)